MLQDPAPQQPAPEDDLVKVEVPPPSDSETAFEPEVIPEPVADPRDQMVELQISQPRNLTNNEPLEAQVVEEEEGERQNEFELINEDDYDFQLKKHQQQMDKIELEEFKTEDGTYYLPKLHQTRALSQGSLAAKVDPSRLNDATGDGFH